MMLTTPASSAPSAGLSFPVCQMEGLALCLVPPNSPSLQTDPSRPSSSTEGCTPLGHTSPGGDKWGDPCPACLGLSGVPGCQSPSYKGR